MVQLDTVKHYTEIAHRAIREQRQRLMTLPPRLEDGYLFAIALADLLKAASVARVLTSSVALAPAVEAFEVAVPRARDFRNLVEHWDEYLDGKGRRQAQLGLEPGQHWFWWKSVSPAVLRIGGEKAGLDLDIRSATAAAIQLYEATVEALHLARGR
jgi:hypothetical protein